jgi:Astacin (Peptidase family M12A)
MLIPGIEGRNGLVQSTSKWPNGRVPYTFGPSVSSADRQMILRAIGEYHAKTCIRFSPRTTEVDFIQFESSATGCWSSVGRVGKKQTVNLQSPGCTTKIGTAIHEIMHALAFLHEQNRYDRDSYVQIVTSNIKPGKSSSESPFLS